MLAAISVVLGMVILIGSMFVNAIQGIQIALIGVGFILIGLYLELRNASFSGD